MASQELSASGLKPVPAIAREEILTRLRDPSLTLVNVLPRAAFDAERIPGSISLPVSELNHLARNLLPNLSQEIAVYCASPT